MGKVSMMTETKVQERTYPQDIRLLDRVMAKIGDTIAMYEVVGLELSSPIGRINLTLWDERNRRHLFATNADVYRVERGGEDE